MAGDGALKVGDVYVVVSAAIGDFAKSMQSVLKTVESTAKKVKEAARGIGEVGAIFAAGMGAALLASSETNAAVQADLQRLKDYLYTFAADIGDALGPHLKRVADFVGELLAAFQRLSPEVKAAVAQAIALGAAVGGAGLVVSKAAGLVEGLAKAAGLVLVPALDKASDAAKLLGQAFKDSAIGKSFLAGLKGMEAGVGQAVAKMALSFAGLLVPIAAVVAAVAVVALAAGAVYEAWNDTGTGLKATVLDIWNAAKELGARLFATVGGWISSLKEGLMRALKAVLEGAAFVLRKIGTLMAPVMRALKLDSLAGMYEEMSKLTGDQLLRDLQTSASFLVDKAAIAGEAIKDAAVSAGKDIVTSVSYGAKGLKRMWSDLGAPKWLQGLLGGVDLGGGEPRVRASDKSLKARAKLEKEIAELNTDMARESAEEMRKAMAAEERAAAASWAAMADDSRAAAEAIAARVAEVRASLVDRALGALGSLGSIIQNAVQAAAGGPLAAVASVVLDLLLQSKGFETIIKMVSAILEDVADALGAAFAALQPFVAAIWAVVTSALPALTPLFDMLGESLAPLAPPLLVVAQLLTALMPVLTMIIQALQLISTPFMLLAGPVMKGLFEVLKFVSTVILKVVEGISKVWNGIVGAIQSVFRTLAQISVFGVKPLGFLEGWADSLEHAMVDTDALAEALVALNGLTWESAKVKAEEIAETLRNRDALKEVNEQLTNIPRGFRINQERYRAQDPVTSFPFPTMPLPPPTAPPPASRPPPPGMETNPGGGAGAPEVGVGAPLIQWGDVTITGVAPQEALQQLERMAENTLRRLLGGRGAMLLPFGGGG